MKAERDLRQWIRSILADAANESRISEIADFVVQRWEFHPERTESDERYDSDSAFLWEGNDSIDSCDEESSAESGIEFCGYKVDEDLVESVWELVDEALKEHESAIRFYGLGSRTPKAVFCHCRELRGLATSLAETLPIDKHHMLVRDPPPWDSLYGPDVLPLRRIGVETREKPSLSEFSHLNPDRSSARAKKSMQVMLSMVAQRSLPAIPTIPSHSFTPAVSKNPFRKDSTRGLTHGGLKDPHRRHGDLVRGENSDCVPDGSAPKRMKSISQIPIPPRPTPPTMTQSARMKNSKDGASGIVVSKKPRNLKQTTLLEMFGKRT